VVVVALFKPLAFGATFDILFNISGFTFPGMSFEVSRVCAIPGCPERMCITATPNLDVILVVTSATAQGKQIKAVPLTMVHAPPYLPASSCRITKHSQLYTLLRIHSMPLSSDHLLTTDLSLSLMMIQPPLGHHSTFRSHQISNDSHATRNRSLSVPSPYHNL